MKLFRNISDNSLIDAVQRHIENGSSKLAELYNSDPDKYSLLIIAAILAIVIIISFYAGRRSRSGSDSEAREAKPSRKIRYEDIDWTIHEEGSSSGISASAGECRDSELAEDPKDVDAKTEVKPPRQSHVQAVAPVMPERQEACDASTDVKAPEVVSTKVEEVKDKPAPVETDIAETPVLDVEPKDKNISDKPDKPLPEEMDSGDIRVRLAEADRAGASIIEDAKVDDDGTKPYQYIRDLINDGRRSEELIKSSCDASGSEDDEDKSVKVEQINLIKAVPYRKFGPDNMNTNRSGRIFTEEELLKQIRD